MRPLVPTFIIERFKKNEKRGSFCSTTLFVDISGFTPLTEQLMQHGTEGAEILSDILDQIFEPLVEQVYAQDGIIPHFAGDAFTAIFEGNKTNVVANIALEMKLKFDKNPFIQTKFIVNSDYTAELFTSYNDARENELDDYPCLGLRN